MFFCLGFSAFTVILHIVPHATDIGISAFSAANILAVMGVLIILGRIVLGSVTDRIGARQTFIIGFIIFSVCLFCMVYARELWALYILVAFVGLAHGGMGASEGPLTVDIFGLRSLGVILGIVALGFTFGGAFGPLITGLIFDITGNYDLAFILCVVLSVVGLILTLLVKKEIPKYKFIALFSVIFNH